MKVTLKQTNADWLRIETLFFQKIHITRLL